MRPIMKVKFNLWMRRVTRVIHNNNSSDAKYLGKLDPTSGLFC